MRFRCSTMMMLAGGSAIALGTSLAHGATMSFQDDVDGYHGTDDTIIREDSSTNFGTNANNLVGHNSNPGRNNRTLLRFDVSSLQGQVQSVDSATLTLTSGGTIQSGEELSFNAVADTDGDWVEGNSGNTGANWALKDKSDSSSDWSGSDGGGPAGQGTTTLLGTATVPNSSNSDFSVNLPASEVEDWIAGDNPGILVRYTDDVDDQGNDKLQTYFRSSNNGVTERHPQLTIKYTPVPEPGSLLLLGASASLLLLGRTGGRTRTR